MKFIVRFILVTLLSMAGFNTVFAQYTTEQAREKLKTQVSVLQEALTLGSSIHVKYEMFVSTFSQTESLHDTAHIEIKKIADKVSFNIDDKHIMLSEGKRSLYYFAPQGAMQYAEDTLQNTTELDKLFFAEILPFIDSAKYVLIEQDKNTITYEMKYADSTYLYKNITMSFNRNTGVPLSMVANFTQSPYQPYANMQVYYKLWDKQVNEKKNFPYFEKYIAKSGEGYAPVESLGKVKYAQYIKVKKNKE